MPPGLRVSDATFATTFVVRDAERARQPGRPAHGGLHRLGELAGTEEVRRDLPEVEVALVQAGALDRRHDLAHALPDRSRVLAVQRMARPDEDRVRAAPQRLRAAHRRVDAEAARDVVRSGDDAAPVRIPADDQRLRREARASISSTAAKKASRSRCATIMPKGYSVAGTGLLV